MYLYGCTFRQNPRIGRSRIRSTRPLVANCSRFWYLKKDILSNARERFRKVFEICLRVSCGNIGKECEPEQGIAQDESQYRVGLTVLNPLVAKKIYISLKRRNGILFIVTLYLMRYLIQRRMLTLK